jgi:glyoxylase I family protein
MRIAGIHHYSVLVPDLEQAVAFYRDVLGLREIALPPTFGPAGVEARWFEVGSQQLHLLPGEADVPSRRHIALRVESAADARMALAERGIDLHETVPIPGADRFFISDPAGNRIEIIEWDDDAA